MSEFPAPAVLENQHTPALVTTGPLGQTLFVFELVRVELLSLAFQKTLMTTKCPRVVIKL